MSIQQNIEGYDCFQKEVKSNWAKCYGADTTGRASRAVLEKRLLVLLNLLPSVAFRGDNELVGSHRNGNFLGILELIAQNATFLHSISKLKPIAARDTHTHNHW